MNLIYLYPPKNRGAPDNVGRIVLDYLYHQKHELLPELKVISTKAGIKQINEKYPDLDTIGIFNLIKKRNNSVLYIPKSPKISPNYRTLLYFFAVFLNMKIISDYHGDFRIEFRNHIEDKDFLRLLWEIPSALLAHPLLKINYKIVVHSPFMSDLINEKYKLKNSVIIPNGISSTVFDSTYQKSFIKGVPSILYHGRLSERKGICKLINAYKTFLIDNPDSVLYLIGTGPKLKTIKEHILKNNLSKNIVVLGFVDYNTLYCYLRSVDVAIYPSLYDNFPLALIEAMAIADCPVCLSTKTGIYDYINKKSDFYTFPPREDQIINTLSNVKVNEARNNNYIQNQKKFAEKFLWEKVILQYVRFFNSIEL